MFLHASGGWLLYHLIQLFFFFACMVIILYDFCYFLCSHYAVVSFSMPIVACVYVKRVSMLSSD